MFCAFCISFCILFCICAFVYFCLDLYYLDLDLDFDILLCICILHLYFVFVFCIFLCVMSYVSIKCLKCSEAAVISAALRLCVFSPTLNASKGKKKFTLQVVG